ncbi:MAG: hypothetical protein S4CHLAM102_15240 [Chlamydiia bacterium]|nr:hypothetical protein [Chlamydiia bacterium]
MKHQEVLLIEDIPAGRKGEVVKVKSGYARNFLLPQHKATLATKGALRSQEKLRQERAVQAAQDKADAERLGVELKNVLLETERKVGTDNRMFGSVTAADISALLAEKGYEIARRDVVLDHAFKKIGTYPVNLKLKEGVSATVNLLIKAEGGKVPEPEPAEDVISTGDSEDTDAAEDKIDTAIETDEEVEAEE